jgi:SAM-dependent methyltransferase
MTGSVHNDHWDVGAQYEDYVGRWSRHVAEQFVRWLVRPPYLEWLDVGCGTGALTRAILALAQPKHVESVDPSAGFIEHARRSTPDARVAWSVGDARQLPVATASADVAVAGLVLNFVPGPVDAVREMARATRAGGTVAAYVWDYAERMQMMRVFWDAAAALDPAAAALDEGARFPLCRPGPLVQLFGDAGLHDVEVRAIDIETNFVNFDDFWSPFLGGQGPAPAYAMSLDEERRSALRERVRSALPVAADGTIRLIARAWAVRGARN